MRSKWILTAAALLGFVLANPAQARADWLFTPFVGANFGGDTPGNSVNFGGSFGYMGAGAVGFEVDFGYAPDFYKSDPLFDGNVTSLMANVIVGGPIGGTHGPGVRPYVSGGGGLLRSHVDDVTGFFENINNNSFGVDVGGGAMVFISDNVGIRGDLRYFRSLKDSTDDSSLLNVDFGSFDFWRAAAGVTFRF